METKLLALALAIINPEEGYKLHSIRPVTQPDGARFVRVLLDYGIGGIKVYMIPQSELDELEESIKAEEKTKAESKKKDEAEPEPEEQPTTRTRRSSRSRTK